VRAGDKDVGHAEQTIEQHGLKRPRAHSALAAPSFLERQLQQLQVVHDELGMLSGPQGGDFNVCDELRKVY